MPPKLNCVRDRSPTKLFKSSDGVLFCTFVMDLAVFVASGGKE